MTLLGGNPVVSIFRSFFFSLGLGSFLKEKSLVSCLEMNSLLLQVVPRQPRNKPGWEWGWEGLSVHMHSFRITPLFFITFYPLLQFTCFPLVQRFSALTFFRIILSSASGREGRSGEIDFILFICLSLPFSFDPTSRDTC